MLKVENLRVSYGHIEALKGISFSLERGELLGFIGPNGAGKSTTIKILSGILRPSSGSCEVEGLVPWRDRIQHVARIGVEVREVRVVPGLRHDLYAAGLIAGRTTRLSEQEALALFRFSGGSGDYSLRRRRRHMLSL